MLVMMTERELDDLLSAPRAETTAALDACPGDIIILGAGGKMGPTLARMAAQACTDSRRVIAVSRWSSAAAERALNDAGVETLRCDLLDLECGDILAAHPHVVRHAAVEIHVAFGIERSEVACSLFTNGPVR